MEMIKTNAFTEMSLVEMQTLDGGGWGEFAGAFVGGMAIAWAPVVAFVCPPAGIGMALGGAGIIGKATGAY